MIKKLLGKVFLIFLMLSMFCVNVFAAVSVKELTYDEAVKEAIKNNSTLVTLADSIEYMDEKSKDSNDILPVVVSTQNMSKVAEMLRGINALDTQRSSADLNKVILEKTTEYMLRTTLTNLAFAEMDLAIAEDSVLLNEQNLKNLQLKQSLGMASDTAVKAASLELDKSKNNINLLKLVIENEKRNLNKLLGKSANDRISVKFEPKMEKLDERVFFASMSQKIEKTPTIKIKKAAFEQAETDLDYGERLLHPMDPNVSNAELDKLELSNKLKKAEREYNDAIKELEVALTKTFNNFKQMQENELTLKTDLTKAEENYETVLLNVSLGNAIRFDADQLELLIQKIKIDIDKNVYNMSNLQFVLENPLLLSQ